MRSEKMKKTILSLLLIVMILFSCCTVLSANAAGNTVAIDCIQQNINKFALFVKSNGNYDKSLKEYVYYEEPLEEEGTYAFNAYYVDNKFESLSCYMYSSENNAGVTISIDIPLKYNAKATVYHFYRNESNNNYFNAFSVIDIPNYNGKNAKFQCIEGNMYVDNATLNSTANSLLYESLLLLDETLYYNMESPIGITGFGFCNFCTHTYVNYQDRATVSRNGYIGSRICKYCGLYIHGKTVVPKISSIALSKKAFYYNGKVQTPKVIVKDAKGKLLKYNVDYALTFSKGRKNIGKYAIVVTFKGKYSGKKALYYTINPGKTQIAKITAGKKILGVKWNKVNSVSGYQIQYAQTASFGSAKYINVKGANSLNTVLKNLNSGKTYYVRIRSYKATMFSGEKVYVFSGWSSVKSAHVK